MATYTSNINLKKPAQSDKIRIADFNTNADNIDAALGAGFGVSSAPSVNAEINSLADGLAIIANGNVHAAISSGQFVYVRGHGTLANGLYVANKNISANATLTSSDLDADSSGGLNTLSSKITWKKIAEETTTANTQYDQTITVQNMSNFSEILFTLQRNSNGRTFASTLVPAGQFNGGATYAFGTYSLRADTIGNSAMVRIINAVAIYVDDTHIELALDANDEAIKMRVYGR